MNNKSTRNHKTLVLFATLLVSLSLIITTLPNTNNTALAYSNVYATDYYTPNIPFSIISLNSYTPPNYTLYRSSFPIGTNYLLNIGAEIDNEYYTEYYDENNAFFVSSYVTGFFENNRFTGDLKIFLDPYEMVEESVKLSAYDFIWAPVDINNTFFSDSPEVIFFDDYNEEDE